MSKVRRNKGGFFLPLERDTLLELIMKYKAAIVNKCTKATSVDVKNRAWARIGCEFNARTGVKSRTIKQLRDLWKNIKANTKREVARRQEASLTSTGGNSDDQQFDPFLQKVWQLVSNEITEDSSNVGDDETNTRCENTQYDLINDHMPSGLDSQNRVDDKEWTNLISEGSHVDTHPDNAVVKIETDEIVTGEEAAQPIAATLDKERDSLNSSVRSNNFRSNQRLGAATQPISDALDNESDSRNLIDHCSNSHIDHRFKTITQSVAATLEKERDGQNSSEHSNNSNTNHRLQTEINKTDDITATCIMMEHNAKMRCLQEEHDLKIKFMKEEHILQMDVLRLKKTLLMRKLADVDTCTTSNSDMPTLPSNINKYVFKM